MGIWEDKLGIESCDIVVWRSVFDGRCVYGDSPCLAGERGAHIGGDRGGRVEFDVAAVVVKVNVRYCRRGARQLSEKRAKQV